MRSVSASFSVLALGLISGCGGPPVVQGPTDEFHAPAPVAGSNTIRVAVLMAGSYSSAAQAAADSAYFDVHLHMVPIWTDRADGPWLYVEQAMADQQSAPYRQRVYHLVDHGRGVVESIVFKLPGDPSSYAGAWRDPGRLNALDPSLLEPRMGCSVFLEPAGMDRFVGSTHGDSCVSDLRGAVSATSEITLMPGMIESWDRGYDAAHQQVWGAKTGPYQFIKQGTAEDGAAAGAKAGAAESPSPR